MLRYAWLGAVALLLGSAASRAAETTFDDRVYLTPMIGGVASGSGDLDTGAFGALVFGKGISPFLGLELEANYGRLDVNNLPADNFYKRFTLGVNVLGYLARDTAAVRPYLLLNGNGHSIDFLDVGLEGLGVGAGAGAVFKLGEHWDARLDARYNLDFINGATENGVTVPDDTFYLWIGSLGVSYKFGANPYDEDADGVTDARDKCPRTPQRVKVNSEGCPLDLDQDGVADFLDRCPNTPPGVQVGTDGCELDSDGDGVADARDRCPGTPRGVTVNADGCPLDGDRDGVPDALDRCADTPADVAVGPDGCPLDADSDGIADDQDECTNTPAGAKVLPNGCTLTGDCRRPRTTEQADVHGCAVEQTFVLRGVKFEFGSALLTPEASRILNDVAGTLQAYPEVAVDIEGHTDAIGSEPYNLGLSERRAGAVKEYLTDRDIAPERMTAIGYGESQPIASNDTDAGREENRRVELRVTEN